MDFFTHQEAARRRTTLLLFYYGLAVAFLIVTIYAAAVAIFTTQFVPAESRLASWWHPQLLLGAAAGTCAVVFLGSIGKSLTLRQGGRAVAEMLGGRAVPPEPLDEDERRLRNVVEEMSIASGTPVPEIYLLDDEPGINAFAAGNSTADMAIGVTRGCVQQLSRDELQGVVGHEFSHILNGDMRLNLRLIALLHGILCIYLVGRILLRIRPTSGGSRKKGGNPLPLFGLALIIIGSAGVLFARLIQAAVSRQREFLADASAVQFTRNPAGLAGALGKIAVSTLGSRLNAPQAAAASHMYFSNGLAKSWLGLTATHPPLEERIRRIDPGFTALSASDQTWPGAAAASVVHSALTGAPRATPPPLPQVTPRQMTRAVGESIPIRYAAELMAALPGSLKEAAHDGWSAVALMFALVLSRTAEVRQTQLQQIAALDRALAEQTEILFQQLRAADLRIRLPLVSLCLPALRAISWNQWQRVRATLDALLRGDAQIDLFEFALKKIIERNVDAHWTGGAVTGNQYYSMAPLADDAGLLISALAHSGGNDPAMVRDAFARGMARLPVATKSRLRDHSDCGLEAIDGALTRLAQAVPHLRQSFLQAAAETVAADGFIQVTEAELLRAIAEALDCPIPPIIQGV